jgi:hypothetical protein
MTHSKPIKSRIHDAGAGIRGGGGPPTPPAGIAGGYVSVTVSVVTAPLIANSRPDITSLVVVVMEVRARIFPMKMLLVPRVAELPTCQKTFAARAPFMAIIRAELAVVSVVPI